MLLTVQINWTTVDAPTVYLLSLVGAVITGVSIMWVTGWFKRIVLDSATKTRNENKLLKRYIECLVYAFKNINGNYKELSEGINKKFEQRWDELERQDDIENDGLSR